MPTYTAFTTLPGAAPAAALAEALELLETAPMGVGQLEVEDGKGVWEVSGYFVDRPDPAGLALLAAMHGAPDFVVSKVPDRDWVAQVRRELTPVHAGRFVVFGSHDAECVPTNKTGLLIDAAMAFGTGHHGTTTGCLESLDALERQGFAPMRVADIGTGTGVLAMAAAHLWPATILASDIDPLAVETARANFRANHLSPRIRAITAPGFRHRDLLSAGPYDLVAANILANPLKRLAPDMARMVTPGGYIVLSGILNRQAQGVTNVFQGHRFASIARRIVGEWSTLTLRAASPLGLRPKVS